MRKGSTGLYFVLAIALTACAATPQVVYQPQIVKVPIASCPVLATLPTPDEYVYSLKPGDSPDKVMKYSAATIRELEAGIKARDAVLDTYRSMRKEPRS